MSVKQLSAEVARKIAAGEVIDRPNAIVRELLDNAVDSGASRIDVEIEGGGIDKIRVRDDGCGMSKEDLEACARPHATSKITTEQDLLNLTTLGFRGEALASMASVSRLQISSGEWKMNASVTEDHVLTLASPVKGTIVQTLSLFENFPARRVFLKRPSSEGTLCKNTFIEKALPRPDIAFTFTADGEEKYNLSAGQTLIERFTQGMELFENANLFYEIKNSACDKKTDGTEESWSFSLVIGEPSVFRNNRKDIYIYVNGRRIQEYSLVQAIEYGCTGYFPNGTHPVACLFVKMNPALVDFNIHPAKKEARFKDISALHHSVSTSTKDFFRQYTIKTMIEQDGDSQSQAPLLTDFSTKSTGGIVEHYLGSPKSSHSSYTNITRGGYREQLFASSKSSPESSRMTRESWQNSGFDAQSIASQAIKDFNQGMDFVMSGTQNNDDKNASTNNDDDKISKPNYIRNDADEESDSQENKSFHFVGITLGTFLIAEKNDTLYIIDQHAAHERYLYNKIMADAGQKQTLLVPYVVQTESDADDNYLTALQEKLEQAGFTGRKCKNGIWEFTTVPIRWKGSEKDLAKDLLDRRISPTDMINAVAASTACRSAVMDGTVLDMDTAAWIAKEALKLPDPHCPHGRPVYTTITRKQLFALVKRT